MTIPHEQVTRLPYAFDARYSGTIVSVMYRHRKAITIINNIHKVSKAATKVKSENLHYL